MIGCNSNAAVGNCNFLAAITPGIISFFENFIHKYLKKEQNEMHPKEDVLAIVLLNIHIGIDY